MAPNRATQTCRHKVAGPAALCGLMYLSKKWHIFNPLDKFNSRSVILFFHLSEDFENFIPSITRQILHLYAHPFISYVW